MKLHSLFFLVGLSAGLVASHPTTHATYALKDHHPVPPQWTNLARASTDHTLHLQIGLKQSSSEDLDRHLDEISDPDHARYGQHLSAGEVHALVAPSEEALDAVRAWLQSHAIPAGAIQYSPAHDWLSLTLPVSTVERLLATEYHVYTHADGSRLVRAEQYSLPQALHAHVDVVQPTNFFGSPRAMTRKLGARSRSESARSGAWHPPMALQGAGRLAGVCDEEAVTGECVRALYGTAGYVPRAAERNSVAAAVYLGDVASGSDFRAFMTLFRPDASPTYTFNTTTIAAATPNSQAEDLAASLSREANLDIQTLAALSHPAQLTTYSTAGRDPYYDPAASSSEPFLTWTQHLLSLPAADLPHIISTSYGYDERAVPRAYAERICGDLRLLGLRGVTLLFAAGDDGVAGHGGDCSSLKSGKGGDEEAVEFHPVFPATCPHVTAIGATRGFAPEVVMNDRGVASGAGVSNYFARPTWQAETVGNYLAGLGNLHKGKFNSSGRAYPDVAAQGWAFQFVHDGKVVSGHGTSVAAPVVAGVLANVNDALLAAGKPALGFLNPWLYKLGSGRNRNSLGGGNGFNDIFHGSVSGCGTSGFPAAEGWDLASGFGTPDFAKILAARNVSLSA